MSDPASKISQPSSGTGWRLGPYSLSDDGMLMLGDSLVSLSPLQRRLLQCFVRHNRTLLSKEQLMREVWGHEYVSEVSLARAVHSLRQVFAQGPLGSQLIRTVYGTGYILEASVREIDPPGASPVSPSPGLLPSLVQDDYFDALLALRQQDPTQLAFSESLLRRCLKVQPHFTPALVALTETLILQRACGDDDPTRLSEEIEILVGQAEAQQTVTAELEALRAEKMLQLHRQPHEAAQSFRAHQTIAKEPGPGQRTWARVLLGLGESRLALQLLEQGLDPERPHGWLLAALAHAHLGQFQAALEALGRQRQTINPAFPLPLNHLSEALILASQGDSEAALTSLSASGILTKPFGSLHAIAATVLALAGQRSQARSLVVEAHRLEPRKLGLASLWGLAALNLDDKAGAEHFFRLATTNGCAAAYYLVDSAFLAPHQQDAVVTNYRRKGSGRPQAQTETLIAMAPWRADGLKAMQTP
ncbi:MAG: winged helix-turn-helix domain-containing protein [Cyanobacteria bacterium]|nr:winged helix-turn-helix domain-containing protein [Cyanobacteriota bacterium]